MSVADNGRYGYQRGICSAPRRLFMGMFSCQCNKHGYCQDKECGCNFRLGEKVRDVYHIRAILSEGKSVCEALPLILLLDVIGRIKVSNTREGCEEQIA